MKMRRLFQLLLIEAARGDVLIAKCPRVFSVIFGCQGVILVLFCWERYKQKTNDTSVKMSDNNSCVTSLVFFFVLTAVAMLVQRFVF